MSFKIDQMTIDEYANGRVTAGDRVAKVGSVYWTRTKGLFYRPLLSYEAYSLSANDLPRVFIGGFQCVVSDPKVANSAIKFVMLNDVEHYDLAGVGTHRRNSIKRAAKLFAVRPVDDEIQFKEQGFQAYCSFYARTRYEYKRGRTQKDFFYKWAESLLKSSKTLVLGGYDNTGDLKAVSISCWVGHTLTYLTFFAETTALKNGVHEIMLHRLREVVSQTNGIHEVFLRRYQGGNGMDEYYVGRGAKVVVKPAKLHIDPVSTWALKSCFPAKYATLFQQSDSLS